MLRAICVFATFGHVAMGLSFRQAEADDLERLIDVHTSAFPDARDRDARSLASEG
jgi:hypothetical protein